MKAGAIVLQGETKMTDIPFDRSFWNDVIRRVSRRTTGYADTEDLVQAAFVRMQNYSTTRQVDNPAAFLVRTAVNIRLDAYRREKLLGKRQFTENFEEYENQAPLQDEVLVARARLERVKSGIERLPARTREIFLMHRLENVKYSEIAKRLGISESAVEKHVARATLFLIKWSKGW
jgi:RNA polymerase sigma factor (sigma-70 family)